MYRKLNCHNRIAAILIFFILVFAQSGKTDAAYSGAATANLAELSAQIGNSLTAVQLKTKNKTERFRPNAFFSARGMISIIMELNQKFQVLTKKGWELLLNWIKGNKFLFVISSGIIFCILFSVYYYDRQKKRDRLMTTTRLSVVNSLVQQACRYIEKKHAETDLTVDKICNDLVTGNAYLEVLFKKELGMRVEDFIDQVRINRVKIIVNKDTQISMQEIAAITGFYDENECRAKFYNICGVDFENYRKKIIHSSNQF